jgi:hypothetical protein
MQRGQREREVSVAPMPNGSTQLGWPVPMVNR